MDWLKCNICFNTYNDSNQRPRSLSCGHTFCEKCLENTVQNEVLTCPQCRKIQEVNSVLDLPINFIAEGLLKSLNNSSRSQDVFCEGATSIPNDKESDTDVNSESHGSLRSLLEQQEISLSAQKELLKKSAGMCIEHPSKECMFRCSLHKSWVCVECIEEHGDHPKLTCRITPFKEEIECRKQEHKKCLEDEGELCDKTLYDIERHICSLKNEREGHINLIKSLQNLINIHNKEEENLQNEITTFENIIEKGTHVKKSLEDVETTVINAATLDESNAARDMVKTKKTETRNWITASQIKVDDGKLQIEISEHIAVGTKKSLEYREQIQILGLVLEKNVNQVTKKNTNMEDKIKLKDIELTRNNLNIIVLQYGNMMSNIARSRKKDWNFYDSIVKVQLILLGLLSKISDNAKDNGSTTWAVKKSSLLAGQLDSDNDKILLHTMQHYENLPQNAITLPFNKVMALVPSQPMVFLTLSLNGTTVCDLHISLFNHAFPRRIQQFVDLVTGSNDYIGYKNARIDVINYHKTAERVRCQGSVTATGRDQKSLYEVEEAVGHVSWTKGQVYVQAGQSSAFLICTRSDNTESYTGTVIGGVTSGMELLKDAINKFSVKARYPVLSFVISDCGVTVNCND